MASRIVFFQLDIALLRRWLWVRVPPDPLAFLCFKKPGKEVCTRVVSPEGSSANSGKELQNKVCVFGKFPSLAVP